MKCPADPSVICADPSLANADPSLANADPSVISRRAWPEVGLLKKCALKVSQSHRRIVAAGAGSQCASRTPRRSNRDGLAYLASIDFYPQSYLTMHANRR